jgi:hypothetical protein
LFDGWRFWGNGPKPTSAKGSDIDQIESYRIMTKLQIAVIALCLVVYIVYTFTSVHSSEPRDQEFLVSRSSKNKTFGLMFVVYGPNYKYFLNQTRDSVASIKSVNPDLPIAVFSPADTLDFEVDFHIKIKNSKIPREFYTRITIIPLSPFDVTFALDSQIIACSPLNVTQIMKAVEGKAMLNRPKYCDAGRSHDLIVPCGGAIIFNKGPSLDILMASWKKIHLSNGGDKNNYDDQKSLVGAMSSTHDMGIKTSMMPPHWFTYVQKSSESTGSPVRRRSAIIHELPWFFHLSYDGNGSSICRQLGPLEDPVGWQIVQHTPTKYELVGVSSEHTCDTNTACCSNTTSNTILI